jgi:hypothetical protein
VLCRMYFVPVGTSLMKGLSPESIAGLAVETEAVMAISP